MAFIFVFIVHRNVRKNGKQTVAQSGKYSNQMFGAMMLVMKTAANFTAYTH